MRVELTRLCPSRAESAFEGRDVCKCFFIIFDTWPTSGLKTPAILRQILGRKLSKLGAASSHDRWETIKVDGHCYIRLRVSVCVTGERNQVVTVITGELMVITSKERSWWGELANFTQYWAASLTILAGSVNRKDFPSSLNLPRIGFPVTLVICNHFGNIRASISMSLWLKVQELFASRPNLRLQGFKHRCHQWRIN